MIIPIIATLFYFLSNWYIYSRFIQYFNLSHSIISIFIIIFLTFSMPIAMTITKKTNQRNYLYSIGTNWFGTTLIILFFTVLTDIVNFFYYNQNNYFIALILIALSIIYSIINANMIKIKKIKIKNKDNLNLVLISDVHLGDRYGKKELKQIVEKIKKINPEVVLIAGDFFDGGKYVSDDELMPLKEIKVPIFMVFGNHDFYYGEEEVIEQMPKYVKLLRNEKIKFKNFEIIGIDDGKIEKLKNIKHSDNSILLYHKPWNTKYFFESNAFLMLSGHTHNGQLFPFYINFIYKYAYGLYKENNKWIYTSSGVLGWGPKMRFGSNNEIVNIKITKDI